MKNLVIVPTYNERENIQNLIDGVLAISGVDLLVIDDNSPDGTGEMAERHKAQGTSYKLSIGKGKWGWARHMFKDLNML